MKFCNACNRLTKHSVSDGRIGRCMEHDAPELSKKQQRERARRDRETRNPRMF